MKIENIENKNASAIATELKAMGINNSRLDGAVSSTYLPTSGTFVDYEVINPLNETQLSVNELIAKGEEVTAELIAKLSPEDQETVNKGEKINKFTHVVIIDDEENQISLSRLQISGIELTEFNKLKEEGKVPYVKSRKNTYFIKGEAINPNLAGNQAALLKRLLGKPFSAELVKVVTTKFDETGYKTTDKVETDIKDAYKIALD